MAQSVTMTGIARTRSLGTSSVSVQALSSLQSVMKTDLANVFFNLDEFAESVTYVHAKLGQSTTYKMIFDDPAQDIKVGSNTEILGAKPQARMSLSHMLQAPHISDVLVVQGIRYSIDSYESDGVGVCTIYLVREGKALN